MANTENQQSDATEWTPTHYAVVEADGNTTTTALYLPECPGPAYTREEWDTESNADWECDEDGEWTFQGQSSPHPNSEVRIVTASEQVYLRNGSSETWGPEATEEEARALNAELVKRAQRALGVVIETTTAYVSSQPRCDPAVAELVYQWMVANWEQILAEEA